MNICTYDNPSTMRRECWQDGKLLCSYSYRLLGSQKGVAQPPPDRFFFGANVGPWEAGKFHVGDVSAMRRGEDE